MTIERIAVGTDGSAMAGAALRWAAQLAKPSGAEVIAINAFANPYSEVRPETHDRLLAERRDLMAGPWIAPAVTAGASVRSVVRTGDPRDVVLRVAEEEAADLVVLGRTGAGGGPGFLHLGSVVEHTAHHTATPLAVIPASDTHEIGRIVIGVDGSEESRRAIDWVGEVAPMVAAEVVAVEVEEPILEWTPSTSPENWRRDAERRIEERTAPLTEAGLTVAAVAQRDLHPADGLLGVAGARHGDLLVVGTRGLGGFSGLRAGGVALKVLHRANLPVVLVPAE